MQLVPYDWRTCLTFRGAKDLGFLKSILDEYALNGVNSLNDSEDDAIRAAESENLCTNLFTNGWYFRL